MTTSSWHLPAGTAAGAPPVALHVSPERAGWDYSALSVLDIPAGGEHTWDTGEFEAIALPLAGGFTVDCDGTEIRLSGRAGVFAGPTDFAYLPPGSRVTVRSARGGRLALPAARSDQSRPAAHVPAAEVAVELRGAGACSRQVHNFGMGGFGHPARLLACEVITPGGNWSSYPPHKHDTYGPDEVPLEEIYYFELSDPAGLAYHRGYGPGIDVLAEIRTGDVVLVPHGWHGPSMAAPGYHLYYLNVMAGPAPGRAWLISDDPDHAWIRDTWAGRPVDPRLPMRGGAA